MRASSSMFARAAARSSSRSRAIVACSALMGRCRVRRSSSTARDRAVVEARLAHRGEEPREAEAGQPRPHRLFADAEIPGTDHGIGASDQVVDRQHADAAIAQRHAAVGGVVAIVAHDKQMAGRYRHFRGVVEPPLSRILKIAWLTPPGSVSM